MESELYVTLLKRQKAWGLIWDWERKLKKVKTQKEGWVNSWSAHLEIVLPYQSKGLTERQGLIVKYFDY